MDKFIEGLRSMATSSTDMEEMVAREFLVNGLIKHKMHVVYYGASGTGKTTIMFHQCNEILKGGNNIKNIFYFLLDGAEEIALMANKLISSQRLTIVTRENAKTILNYLRQGIEGKEDMTRSVFIFDTYKKFQSSINSKEANSEHMHFIRQLTNLGATCISLAHTNKSGDRESGTAELEQDSDALFRFDKMKHNEDGFILVSISEAGRVRYHPTPRSYILPKHDPNIEKVKQVEYFNIQAYKPILDDPDLVTFLKSEIVEGTNMTRSKLYKKAQVELGASKGDVVKVLKAGLGILWVKGRKVTSGDTYIPLAETS